MCHPALGIASFVTAVKMQVYENKNSPSELVTTHCVLQWPFIRLKSTSVRFRLSQWGRNIFWRWIILILNFYFIIKLKMLYNISCENMKSMKMSKSLQKYHSILKIVLANCEKRLLWWSRKTFENSRLKAWNIQNFNGMIYLNRESKTLLTCYGRFVFSCNLVIYWW